MHPPFECMTKVNLIFERENYGNEILFSVKVSRVVRTTPLNQGTGFYRSWTYGFVSVDTLNRLLGVLFVVFRFCMMIKPTIFGF